MRAATGRMPSPYGEVEARALLGQLSLVEPRGLILVDEGEQVSEAQTGRRRGLTFRGKRSAMVAKVCLRGL
ncbi:hypothetical protein WMF39_33690 [Sorangium sp. So ce1504]|uniref:hypothetical protein n=1 Tax=Sorangium sp. So ce1504 TaxID=3133337 RepID=UPI003F6153E1